MDDWSDKNRQNKEKVLQMISQSAAEKHKQQQFERVERRDQEYIRNRVWRVEIMGKIGLTRDRKSQREEIKEAEDEER